MPTPSSSNQRRLLRLTKRADKSALSGMKSAYSRNKGKWVRSAKRKSDETRRELRLELLKKLTARSLRLAIQKGLNAAGIDPRNPTDKKLRDFVHHTLSSAFLESLSVSSPDIVPVGSSLHDRGTDNPVSDKLWPNLRKVFDEIKSKKGRESLKHFQKGLYSGLGESSRYTAELIEEIAKPNSN